MIEGYTAYSINLYAGDAKEFLGVENMAERAGSKLEIDGNVIRFIPRSGVRERAGVREYAGIDVREAGMLGCRYVDNKLETNLRKLHQLRKERAISLGELEEMCAEEFNHTINTGQNLKYVEEFHKLLVEHERFQQHLSIGERLEDIYLLREKYKQN
ncbi:hypothetical protein HZC30_07630 [Candidatus Woesearchaeota archaeon]|nr:hypothetical protein [Candidatus Woesearchaeota archaeon]